MKRSKLQRKLVPYLFCLPFLAFFVVFFVAPLIYAAWLSFYRETIVGGMRFNGISNYVNAVVDETFWNGWLNVMSYGAVLIPVLLLLALLLALLLDSRYVAGRAFFQVCLFIPYAIPGVIAALIWAYLYGPTFGPIAQTAVAMGLPKPPLLTSDWILASLANISIWGSLGYNMIIIFAALKTIPHDLDEAASLDGAGELQYALKVKIPLVGPAILLNAVFAVIGTLQLFSEPNILMSLVPHVINSAYTPNMYTRSLAFISQDFSYAAAVSFVLAAIVGLLSAIVMLVSGRLRRVR